MIADVVFPLRLKPLTYRVPEGAPAVLEGRIVRAPLGKRSADGVIVSSRVEEGERKALKEVETFHHLLADAAQLALLRWLSEYYLAPMGVALKSMFFEEVAACPEGIGTDAPRTERHGRTVLPDSAWQSDGDQMQALLRGFVRGGYAAFLHHSACRDEERQLLVSLLARVCPHVRGIAILVPEVAQIEPLASQLRDLLGDRLAVLHRRLPKGRMRETVCRVWEGDSDVVIGTRSAILAPLRKPSLIAVLGEHSPAYKAEEGLRYHGRDVAVMRGFLESACVLLSSCCPSLESAFNARSGKYTLLSCTEPERPGPRKVVVGLRKTAAGAGAVSPQVLRNVKEVLGSGQRFLFLVHRKGYSYLRCRECRDLLLCPTCAVPVPFHQAAGLLRCRRCWHERRAPDACPSCGGAGLEPLGAGTERVREDLQSLLGTEVLLVEKGRGRRGERQAENPDSALGGLVVGTPYAVRRSAKDLFGGAVIVSLDQLLSQPNFRSHERTFQEVVDVAQTVAPEGRLFLQTWAPRARIVRQIARFDYLTFYEDEIAQRRELGYPPLARLVLITVTARDEGGALLQRIRSLAKGVAAEGVEILGPAQATGRRQVTGTSCQLLLKSRDRKSLHAVSRELLSALERLKGTRVVVDVDPLEV